jgi:hypothetical protein
VKFSESAIYNSRIRSEVLEQDSSNETNYRRNNIIQARLSLSIAYVAPYVPVRVKALSHP